MQVDSEKDPANLRRPGREKQFSVGMILAPLSKGALTAAEWKDKAMAQHNMSQSTFYSLQKTAKREGRVQKSGEKWEIT